MSMRGDQNGLSFCDSASITARPLAFKLIKNIGAINRLLLQCANAQLAHLDLDYATSAYLLELDGQEFRSQQSLADALSQDKAATTRTLVRLETRGLVRRGKCEADKRVVLVCLTDEGRSQIAGINAAMAATMYQIQETLTEIQSDQLLALLKQIVELSEVAGERPTG